MTSMIRARREPLAAGLRRTGMSSRRYPVIAAVAVAVAVALLAGCANGSNAGSAANAGSGSSASASSSPSPTPSTPPKSGSPSGTVTSSVIPPPVTNGSGGYDGTVTVSGTVKRGAEPSCLILTTPTGEYQLLDAKPVPDEGAHVTVVGRLATQIMSHCMQGKPLRVTSITVR